MQALLVANGPGELYAWAQPVLRTLRRLRPELEIAVVIAPDQFSSGAEAATARGFGADVVVPPGAFVKFLATGRTPAGLGGERGFVLSLGGNLKMALRLAGALGYSAYRYGFVPTWDKRLQRLFVHDEAAERKARRGGAPPERLECVGNLVADAVAGAETAQPAGHPHVVLLTGTRDAMSALLIPFMLGTADRLGQAFPGASFVWPVSPLLKPETVCDGIAGVQKEVLGGVSSRREGDRVVTPGGVNVCIVPEHLRYAHMRAADLALTIPGTNTLELGIAGVPSLVLLPMNKPEVIPLEGVGQWLGLIPGVGKYVKRYAVKLFVEGLDVPVSLPNRFTGEELMVEMKGKLDPGMVAERATALLNDPQDLPRRRERLAATMPKPGAAERLVTSILGDFA